MVECLENQLAARPPTGGGTKRSGSVQHRGDNAPIVDPEPRSAGEHIEPPYDFRPIRPVAARRLPRAVDYFVAVGADQYRPALIGPAQNHYCTHSANGVPALPVRCDWTITTTAHNAADTPFGVRMPCVR